MKNSPIADTPEKPLIGIGVDRQPPEPEPEFSPVVCARYRGVFTIPDKHRGSRVEVVEFVVRFAGSDYQSKRLAYPAVRGHVWTRSQSVDSYERAAEAAVSIATSELCMLGRGGLDIHEAGGDLADWREELRQAVVNEFFLGPGMSPDEFTKSGGWGTIG